MKLTENLLIKQWLSNKKYLWIISIVWLLTISFFTLLWHLGDTGLVDETEPLFAEASRQIIVRNDWITPYFNEVTRFDKPILIYWLMALCFKIVGVNEWGVRLPSALSAIALIFLTFYTLLKFGYPSPKSQENIENNSQNINLKLWFSAILSATIIPLSLPIIAWSRQGVSDMLLTACMDGALLAFFQGYAQETPIIKKRWYWTFYILISLAILTKGPVGIVLPAIIITAFLFYLGNFRTVLAEMQLIQGLVIMAIATLPWYILVTIKNGSEFINSFFGYHNIERFTEVVNHHSAPEYFYFLVVLLGFLPWSMYLPFSMIRLQFWQRKNWQNTPRETQLGLFSVCWFLAVFIFFTIAVTKLPSYMLPLMPAAAILVGLCFSNYLDLNHLTNPQIIKDKGLLISSLFNLLFAILLAITCFSLNKIIGYDPAVPNLQELLQISQLPMIGGIIWSIIAMGILFLIIKNHWQWLWTVNLIGFLAFIIFWLNPVYFLIDETRQLPLREIAKTVQNLPENNTELVMIGFKKPTIVFYSHRHFNFFDFPYQAMNFIKTQSDKKSMFVITRAEELQKTGLTDNQYQKLEQKGPYMLLKLSR
jgi:4-amino-4-deoxy-L-arabinose transferase-like glycosyltransferase